MRRLKPFGERIASRDPARQAAEIHTRITLMNHFSALGRAEIVRAAQTQWDKRTAHPHPEWRSKAAAYIPR